VVTETPAAFATSRIVGRLAIGPDQRGYCPRDRPGGRDTQHCPKRHKTFSRKLIRDESAVNRNYQQAVRAALTGRDAASSGEWPSC
jgi:hypothetical protein